MKHIIIGGNGFVGQQLAANLVKDGHQVVVADIEDKQTDHAAQVEFLRIDVTNRSSLDRIAVTADDVIYNLSAKMLSPIMPRAKRRDFFWPVNYHGVANILDWMGKHNAHRLVHFTTDMIYGHTHEVPTGEDAPAKPLGEYGQSKLETEWMCADWRTRGFDISIFRPRLIIGPGRLGILEKLFKLIDYNLPVPMIGSGHNPYQFISVFDCASAAEAAWRAGFPNKSYNLGSDDPPPVRKLLRELITEAGSKSILLPTPAPLVKLTLNTLDFINMPLMDPEQYLIADEVCILDTTAAKTDLNWKPLYRDEDMLKAAYREYRASRTKSGASPSPVAFHRQ
ncbi:MULTISPECIES: NAD(P)-dependent oxidoreductase [unclassified Beijerinckia]|uniref:NAD-dependent epimerase/dehydratase family protein n=1 Tax=unclassified Beijerinckia TaxID=2638183 RepID=UPI0008981C02|nr:MULTISPECIES: NAD(P)-dependent oxidoreductase [unclassified Beijerinckia]MDH7797144.1 dTDP-glucose 4,6-dehydratase [Beijerinckia sp. GAS462]SEC73964.1 dTDP-glucose 4,6-dehydratase [Beijerinckia sp. 28-YEA-48]